MTQTGIPLNFANSIGRSEHLVSNPFFSGNTCNLQCKTNKNIHSVSPTLFSFVGIDDLYSTALPPELGLFHNLHANLYRSFAISIIRSFMIDAMQRYTHSWMELMQQQTTIWANVRSKEASSLIFRHEQSRSISRSPITQWDGGRRI